MRTSRQVSTDTWNFATCTTKFDTKKLVFLWLYVFVNFIFLFDFGAFNVAQPDEGNLISRSYQRMLQLLLLPRVLVQLDESGSYLFRETQSIHAAEHLTCGKKNVICALQLLGLVVSNFVGGFWIHLRAIGGL